MRLNISAHRHGLLISILLRKDLVHQFVVQSFMYSRSYCTKFYLGPPRTLYLYKYCKNLELTGLKFSLKIWNRYCSFVTIKHVYVYFYFMYECSNYITILKIQLSNRDIHTFLFHWRSGLIFFHFLPCNRNLQHDVVQRLLTTEWISRLLVFRRSCYIMYVCISPSSFVHSGIQNDLLISFSSCSFIEDFVQQWLHDAQVQSKVHLSVHKRVLHSKTHPFIQEFIQKSFICAGIAAWKKAWDLIQNVTWHSFNACAFSHLLVHWNLGSCDQEPIHSNHRFRMRKWDEEIIWNLDWKLACISFDIISFGKNNEMRVWWRGGCLVLHQNVEDPNRTVLISGLRHFSKFEFQETWLLNLLSNAFTLWEMAWLHEIQIS